MESGQDPANLVADSLGFEMLELWEPLSEEEEEEEEEVLGLPEGVLEKDESLYKADPSRLNPRARSFTK